MRQLIIGPAGSGKTFQVLDAFRAYLSESLDPLASDAYLILPSAEHVERMTTLALQSGLDGFFQHRITTFPALIRTIFPTADFPIASSASRYLIMKEILTRSDWAYFEEIRDTAGFTHLSLGLISELKESLITPEAFRIKMNKLKTLEAELAPKYEALAQIYERFDARMKQEHLNDPQDLFWHFRKSATQWNRKRFKKLWLDGFFDFSPLQRAYLDILCEFSEDTLVTLTKDQQGSRDSLFSAIAQTEQYLEQMGFVKSYLAPRSRRAESEALEFLERHLFSGKRPSAIPKLDQALAIFDAVGMQGEIEMIAREIRGLVRDDRLRYSDCALLFRQIGNYEPIIQAVFERYGIPVEIHERERTALSPLIQAVVYLFETIREDWKREPLLNFLKSSYRRSQQEGVLADFVYELENAALRSGIFQGRALWMSEWPDTTDKILPADFSEQKKRILSPISELCDLLIEPLEPTKMVQILLQALQGFGVGDLLSAKDALTRRDAAALDRLWALFDEIKDHFQTRGSETVRFEEFSDHFFKLVELDLFSLHHRDKNRVQVYSVSMARQKEYRVVFVCGLLEKTFPVLIKEDPLLSDWERALMSQEVPALPEKLPRQHLERYLFYLAVTRAREKVVLSYPRLDREGKESLPSFYVDEVQQLFQGSIPVRKQNLSHPYPELSDAQNFTELEAALIGALWHGGRADEPLLLALTHELMKEDPCRRVVQKAMFEVRDELTDEGISDEDLFRSSKTSATSLEEYAKCPFRYYANRVLKLKDPEEDVNVRRKGIIMHRILEFYFSRRLKAGRDLSGGELESFIHHELMAGLKEHPLIYAKHYQSQLAVEEMREMLLYFIRAEQERLRSSPLQPAYFEYGFGSGPSPQAEALVVEVGGKKIQLTGIVDRIDVDPARKFALIVDYKRSAKFSRDDLELGIALQLPVYLKAAEHFLGLKPVGGELYSIRECKTTGFYHEENASGLKELSARNLKFKSADFDAQMNLSFDFLKRFLDAIMHQKIPVKPRSCDAFCSYPSVCRIEKWRLEGILEEIKADDAKLREGGNLR